MEGFIPGSVSIGLDGRFAEWAGSLLSFDEPILLVTSREKKKKVLYDSQEWELTKCRDTLNGGYEAWKKAGEEMDMIVNVDADELIMDMPFDKNLMILDVRKPSEFAEGHLKGAINLPLEQMTDPGNYG